ncbi:MAG TPA: site-specific DNA-methyltransferase, partial [Flavobacterium sp.]|nr:site-specific DNA-methyltransferase [Flavobacterium sp.]
LGKYERQFFMDDLVNGQRKRKEEAYLDLICRAYSAQRIENYATLHAKKAGRFVHIGPLDMPVTETRIMEIFEECKTHLITQVDILGFEFEMGAYPRIIQEIKEQGVDIRLRYVPKDVFDARAVNKGQVKFYDVSYLQAKPIIKDNKVKIELTDFVTNYTQDDIEDIQESMRAGSKIVIENGQIFKITKDKNGIIQPRENLTENWHDWIDYWSVDFDYDSKKEIIRIKNESGDTSTGSVEEQWTGNYIFENEWQTFRTKQDRTLEFTSAEHEYSQKRMYRVMVKVVDILGVDTSQIIEIKI